MKKEMAAILLISILFIIPFTGCTDDDGKGEDLRVIFRNATGIDEDVKISVLDGSTKIYEETFTIKGDNQYTELQTLTKIKGTVTLKAYVDGSRSASDGSVTSYKCSIGFYKIKIFDDEVEIVLET
jgi:hypothetical protein